MLSSSLSSLYVFLSMLSSIDICRIQKACTKAISPPVTSEIRKSNSGKMLAKAKIRTRMATVFKAFYIIFFLIYANQNAIYVNAGPSLAEVVTPPSLSASTSSLKSITIDSTEVSESDSISDTVHLRTDLKSKSEPVQLALAVQSPRATGTVRLREISVKNIPGTKVRISNITRQHDGDVFIANDIPDCNMDTCVGLSSGTAGLFIPDNTKTDISSAKMNSVIRQSNSCKCRCLPYLNTYREDLGICVDDIHECTLSPFVSGSSSEKTPFIFLPLRGQIIHPSREISFPGVRTPVCAVTGSQFLTTKGWSELRNPIDADFPFRLFRDEGRTFLQWLGESDLRHKMQGRLILVHLMCRDMSLPPTFTTNEKRIDGKTIKDISKNIFTPCVAFRVNGSPVKYVNNVTEVLFQSETTANLASSSDGLSTKEYVVIGICSLLLGLIYVASVFLYLHVKRRKNQIGDSMASVSDLKNDINYPKNDQVTFGSPFARSGSLYSASNMMDPRSQNGQRQHRGSTGNLNVEAMGIVKNNPLLKHYPNLSDHSGFTSDLSNSNSENDDSHSSIAERIKNMQTSALVHPMNDNSKLDTDRNNGVDSSPSPTQENECLPEENVSITEDIATEDKLDTMRAIVNGTVRKKLYFNPAYFEPHLLMSPPPAAIEFLTKIREVIAIAKYKMATKRYHPSLTLITEEGNGTLSDTYATASNKQSSYTNEAATTKNDSSIKCNTPGCPGCSGRCAGRAGDDTGKCNSCGDKRNSIQKWLESVHCNNAEHNHPNEADELKTTNVSVNDKESAINEDSEKSLQSLDEEAQTKSPTPTNSAKKRKQAPPLPTTAPKIIAHSLKQNLQKVLKAPTCSPPPIPVASPSELSPRMSPMLSVNCDTNQLYSHFAKTGSEIYNNPKFNHNCSPHSSQRSNSKTSRKRMEVLDQYANPNNSERNHYEMLKNLKHMPDMVYEALARDYSIRNYPSDKGTSTPLSIPTPDYDGTFHRNSKGIYGGSQGCDPYVPTPDYSTIGKKSLRQYQPDSPIYRRKSPQYLIVDYETDSLERTTTGNKKCGNSSSSPSSSDSSSQPSPSLSTALPLEEEVEIHHTVYDKVEGFRKDGDITIQKAIVPGEYEDVKADYKKVAPLSPRIKYDTPFRGSMTIEVEHEPQSDIELSTDSDQFEPDTLDRKPKKQFATINSIRSNNSSTNNTVKSLSAWSEHLQKAQSFVNSSDDRVNYSSLENMTSLPDFNHKPLLGQNPLVLQSSNSFRKSTESFCLPQSFNDSDDQKIIKQTFGSLREIYQSKTQKNLQRPTVESVNFTEQGRILTLEAKHSKRQRQSAENTEKVIQPPDVIPSANVFYDTPKTPSSIVDGVIFRKNLKGWNTDDFSGSYAKNDDQLTEDTDACETTSTHSESTEITGVSDTQANSEFGSEKKFQCNQLNRTSVEDNESSGRIFQFDKNSIRRLENDNDSVSSSKKYDNFLMRAGNHRESYFGQSSSEFESAKYLNQIISKQENKGRSPCEPRSLSLYNQQQLMDDADKIEVLSTRSLSNRSVPLANSSSPCRNPSYGSESPAESPRLIAEASHLNIQKVFRVEVCQPTNGMQIAMGLRDRTKKSKDLKNAWKKFISRATSKFNGGNSGNNTNGSVDPKQNDIYEKKSVIADLIDKDEGISSLIDEGSRMYDISYSSGLGGSLSGNMRKISMPAVKFGIVRSHSSYFDNRFGGGLRHEMDSGYMSGDSGESKPHHRRVYERYNFKSMSDKLHIIGIETIEDKSDSIEGNLSNKQISERNSHCEMPQNKNAFMLTNNFNLNLEKPVQVKVYSSDEEPYSSASLSSESEDEGHTEDMCESGAESVETHSVLFKNIRNSQRSKY